GIAKEKVADISHGVEVKAVASPGHEHPRMRALEGVKVRQVEEVSYPAVDTQQVERGGRDEVQRCGVGVKERADLGKSVQHAARLELRPSGGPDHAGRVSVVA